MKLYAIHNDTPKEIHEKPFKREREIQTLFENSLKEVMSLTLVRSEFTLKNRRIDTLAFDEATNAFIIVEYKRDKNVSVIDQGFTYLGLMLENKADFIVEYNEQLKKNLKRNQVDWSQTRVVFVSPSFTDFQIGAANFKDIAIELWEVKQYVNNTVAISQLKKSKSAESIKLLPQTNTQLKKVIDEITVYTEESHLESSPEMAELYVKIRDAILNLADGIDLVPQKHYLAFKRDRSNFVCMKLHRRHIKIFIGAKAGTLDDPKGLASDVSNTGHHGTGDYEVKLDSDADLEYLLSLVKQAL